MTNGHKFSAKFNAARKSFSGLNQIFRTFQITDKETLLFEYIGNSAFKLSIYDYYGFDHLKEVTGEFKLYQNMEVSSDEEGIHTSDSSEDEALDSNIGISQTLKF